VSETDIISPQIPEMTFSLS